MGYYRKVFALVLLVVLLWTSSAGAVANFNNVYYAIQSYSERDYTAYASQTAIGWSEIRKNNDIIYFSQQRISGAVYGVPLEGDIPALINELKANGTKLSLSVFLDNRAIFRELLDKPAMQDQIISDIVDALKGIRYYDYSAPRNAEGFYPHHFVTDSLENVIEYDGIVIDFEQLFDSSTYKVKFNQFLKKLKDRIPEGKKLTVTIPPKRKAPIIYFDGYDYSYIGQIADEVILMAHEYQYDDGSIKATAPIAYVKEALDFAIKEIPKNKILLQVNLSPVMWRNGKLVRDEGLGYSEMTALLDSYGANVTPKASRYNDELQVGYALLKHEIQDSSGNIKTVTDEFYYENARSIAQKRALAGELGIKGMSVWRLGIGADEPLEELLMSKHVRVHVEDFVKRLYNVALKREAEPDGLAHWTDRLITGKYTASKVVQYILLDAPEFLNINLTNEQFIEISYKTFFNRIPDPDGKAYWLKMLNNGYSKRWIMANMLNCPPNEFDKLCKAAGISTGRIGTRASDLPK